MKRNPKKDPITREVREAVLFRDGYHCVAPELARMAGLEIDACRTRFGAPMTTAFGYRADELQIDHVREDIGGRRRSEPRWLQAGCPHHHLDGFLGRKDVRAAARERLERLYDDQPSRSLRDA